MNQSNGKNHLSKLQQKVLKSTFEETELDLCPKPRNLAASTSSELSCLLDEDGAVHISTSSEKLTDVRLSKAATLVIIPITCIERIWITVSV